MTWEVDCPKCGEPSTGPAIEVERNLDEPMIAKVQLAFDASVSSAIETRPMKLTFECGHEVIGVK